MLILFEKGSDQKDIMDKNMIFWGPTGMIGTGLTQYKMMQKSWKMTETLASGYSSESTQWKLSNEYQHDRV